MAFLFKSFSYKMAICWPPISAIYLIVQWARPIYHHGSNYLHPWVHRNPGLTSAAGPSSESSCEWNFPQLGSFISCLLILRALRVSRLLWPGSWLLAPSSSLLAPSRRLPPDTRSGRRTRRRSITIPDCTAASPAIASTPELWTELNPAQFRENLQGKTRAG